MKICQYKGCKEDISHRWRTALFCDETQHNHSYIALLESALERQRMLFVPIERFCQGCSVSLVGTRKRVWCPDCKPTSKTRVVPDNDKEVKVTHGYKYIAAYGAGRAVKKWMRIKDLKVC